MATTDAGNLLMGRRYVLRLLFVCMLLASGHGAAATLPHKLTLTYDVSYGALPLGKITRILVRGTDDNFQFSSSADANALLSLFAGGDIREEGAFRIEDGLIRSIYYHVVREGNDGYDRTVRFDWTRRLILFDDGREEPMEGYAIDMGSAPYLLMQHAPADLAGHEFTVVGRKRLRPFRFGDPEEEDLDTVLGRIRTMRIKQHRLDMADRDITIWVAIDHGNVPVLVHQQRGDSVTKLTLREVKREE